VQPNPALEQFLKSIPLFSLVQPGEMMDILRLLRPLSLEDGAVLFREGEPGNAMWVLGEPAEVAISSTPKGGGRPVVVARATGGDTIGEMALIDQGGRSGTAVVTRGGPAHRIDAVEFQALREKFNPAAYKVLRKLAMDLCAKLRATSDRIVPPGGVAPPTEPLAGLPLPSPEVLDEFPPFRQLPQTVKLALAQKLTLIVTDGVQAIFGEGAAADAAYFVLSGEVTVGRGGRTLASIPAGGMFGLVAAIDAGKRSASCVTTRPSRLLRLDDRDFEALFAAGNKFAFHVVDMVARQLVQHIREANVVLVAQGGVPVPAFTPIQGAENLAAAFDGEAIPLEVELELSL
jgi:CRP-like cAMP-binding protein